MNTVYVLYMDDHTGDKAAEVFTSEEKAVDFMEGDLVVVCEQLLSDGYKSEVIRGLDTVEVYVPDTDIYYNWTILETEIDKEYK